MSHCRLEQSDVTIRAHADRTKHACANRLRKLGGGPGSGVVFPHTRLNSSARLTSWMALVTWMPWGQASVQLNVVRQRHTPSVSLRMSSRASAPWSRESKMNRWAVTIAAGPKYEPSLQ